MEKKQDSMIKSFFTMHPYGIASLFSVLFYAFTHWIIGFLFSLTKYGIDYYLIISIPPAIFAILFGYYGHRRGDVLGSIGVVLGLLAITATIFAWFIGLYVS